MSVNSCSSRSTASRAAVRARPSDEKRGAPQCRPADPNTFNSFNVRLRC